MTGMLSGVTVLELGQVIAGTFGGVILADLGAEVIKIEPHRGDTARNPKIAPLGEESSIHLFMNRGKKSVVIDLKSPEGLDIFYGLVKTADVVVDNFRPGVMARLGVDHETLQQHNPKIITVSITGFGETGPLRNKPAFDLVVQAYSGHMEITGERGGPPARAGVPLADISGGIYSAISVLGALVGRELHGNGQHADVAMLDSMVHLLAYDALHHLTTGATVERQGSAHAHMVPWQAFAVKDGYVVVAARDQKFWLNLCDAMERPDLREDPRTQDNASRLANRAWLVPILEEAFLEKTKAEWVELLDLNDIPSAPVNDFEALFTDPHMEARGMIQTYQHATEGPVRYQPSPMKLSDWTFPNEPAPMLGEHTEAVLTKRLGMSHTDVERLAADGVVAVWPGTE
jgi:crotonobetainyl-CoA:carnitine CoA-transferase CaiB-like acyl-CoA transferase